MTKDQLKSARIAAGLSQSQVGEIFGYSRSAIAMMEAGKRSVPAAISRSWHAQVSRFIKRKFESVTFCVTH